MKWRYSLRWKLPHRPCPGPHELVSEVVEAGQPAPESVMARWVAGAGYAVCVDFLDERQIRRWSDERKAAARRRNLARRVNRIAPLFADELIERELETRPEYFRGKSADKGRDPGQTVTVCGIMAVALEAFCLMTLRWFVTVLCGK